MQATMHITSISGSPSERSRSAWLTQFALTRLEGMATRSHHIAVRELPAQALLAADATDAAIAQAVDAVAGADLIIIGTPIYKAAYSADLIIIGTPIYKAAYSGVLKLFLDLLPPEALRGKTVLPLATGGSPAHLLALDYALKPVVVLNEGDDRIGFMADVRVTLGTRERAGRIGIAGRPRYTPTDGQLFLDELQITTLELAGLPEEYAELVKARGAMAARQALQSQPVYTLDADTPKGAFAKLAVRDVKVVNGKLRIAFIGSGQ